MLKNLCNGCVDSSLFVYRPLKISFDDISPMTLFKADNVCPACLDQLARKHMQAWRRARKAEMRTIDELPLEAHALQRHLCPLASVWGWSSDMKYLSRSAAHLDAARARGLDSRG